MFDSLKDIFSSEPEERSEEVKFDKFGTWFDDRIGETGFSWADVGSKYRRVEKALGEVEENLKNLKSSEMPEEVAPRLLKAGKSNKKELVRQLQRFIDNFDVPQEKDLKTAAEFAREKSEDMGKLSDKIQRNFLFVEKVQEDESKKLLGSVSRLEDEIKPDEELIRAKKIKELYSDIQELLEDKEGCEKELNHLKEKLEESKEKFGSAEKKLEEAEKSVPTDRIKEIKGKIDGLEKEKTRLKNKIIQSISPLRRGLKKLRYFGAAPEGKERLMEKYIESPLTAVEEDEGLDYLKKLKEALGKALEGGNLDFSRDEKGKMRNEVRSLKVPEVEELKRRRSSTTDKIQELNSEVEELKLGRDREKLELNLKERKEEVERLSSRMDKKVKDMEGLEREIKSKKKDLKGEVKSLLNIDLEFLE